MKNVRRQARLEQDRQATLDFLNPSSAVEACNNPQNLQQSSGTQKASTALTSPPTSLHDLHDPHNFLGMSHV